jgi:Fur family ferric uptake transcriptional regulator
VNNTFLKTIFRENRLRLSVPRLLIYQELASSLSPRSPLEIYHRLLKRNRRIGLTSIYRALGLFESLGIAFKIAAGSNGKYRLCEREDHHHHIICKTCGEVVEFSFCDMESWSQTVMESTGYLVTDHQLSLHGICSACQSNEGKRRG